MTQKPEKHVSRRTALGMLGGAAGGALAARPLEALAQGAPAVRKKATITWWTWADNPVHQKMSIDAVELFDPALEQQILDLPQGQRIANVHHHCEADHLGRTVEAAEGIA